MIVELTFQVWIPIKNQEVTKPNIETAIFLRGLGKKILYLCAVMQYYAQKQTFFPNINETEKWWCKLDFKIECNYMCTSYYM